MRDYCIVYPFVTINVVVRFLCSYVDRQLQELEAQAAGEQAAASAVQNAAQDLFEEREGRKRDLADIQRKHEQIQQNNELVV